MKRSGRPIGKRILQVCEALEAIEPATPRDIEMHVEGLKEARKYCRRAAEYRLMTVDEDRYSTFKNWRQVVEDWSHQGAARPIVGINTRPPGSVWELGQGLQTAGTWPPEGAGQRYTPLGPWVEEATNDNDRSAA